MDFKDIVNSNKKDKKDSPIEKVLTLEEELELYKKESEEFKKGKKGKKDDDDSGDDKGTKKDIEEEDEDDDKDGKDKDKKELDENPAMRHRNNASMAASRPTRPASSRPKKPGVKKPGLISKIKKVFKREGIEFTDSMLEELMDEVNSGVEISEAEVNVDGVIKSLGDTDWHKDNESQMKAVQLLKGIALSDDPKSNAFMAKMSNASTSIAKDVLDEMKIESDMSDSAKHFSLLMDAGDSSYVNPKKAKKEEIELIDQLM